MIQALLVTEVQKVFVEKMRVVQLVVLVIKARLVSLEVMDQKETMDLKDFLVGKEFIKLLKMLQEYKIF